MPTKVLDFASIVSPYDFIDVPGASLYTRHPEPKFKIGTRAEMSGNRYAIYGKASTAIPGPADPAVGATAPLSVAVALVADTGVISAGTGYQSYAGFAVGECGFVVKTTPVVA